MVLLVVIGLCASFTLLLPSRELSIGGHTLLLSGRTVLGLILIGLTCTGVEAIVTEASYHQHPSTCHAGESPTPFAQPSVLAWILPTALVAAAWALLNNSASTSIRVIGVLLTGTGLTALVVAEYYLFILTNHLRGVLDLSLRLITYLIATLLYVAIGQGIPAGWLTTLIVTLVSALMTIKLISDDQNPLERIWPLALAVGVAIGLGAWLSCLWTTTALMRALAQVILLYMLTGVARPWYQRHLTRHVVAEYLLVGFVALVLLISYTR
jgi:hypothetical protein